MNGNNGFLNSIPVVTRNLIIINVLVWLLNYILKAKGFWIPEISELYGRPMTILDWYGGLHHFSSQYFMPHQLITAIFMHGDFGHMFFNMFAVFMFGRTLETVWGPKRFLMYYMITGIGAGLVQELVWFIQFGADPIVVANLLVVGASGAVFGILLAFGMLFPNAELLMLFFPIPIKAKYFVIGYGILELFLGVANFSGDNVAHFAHLGGLLFGIIMILYWKRTNKQNGRFY